MIRRCLLAVMALGAAITLAGPAAATTTTTSSTTSTTSTTIAAAATAAVSVVPDTGLSDLQTVTISGTGFSTGEAVNLAQCNLFAGKAGGVCYAPTHKTVTASSSGDFSTSFVVRRVIVESGSSADCGTAPATCGIAAGGTVHTAFATLTFSSSVPANRPHITVTPTTGLQDAATVQVSGSGFTPDSKVVLAQCVTGTIGLTACDRSTEQSAVADANGVFPTTAFVVHTRIFAGAQGLAVDCSSTETNATPCSLVAANAIGASEFGASTLTFGAPPLPRTGGNSGGIALIALASLAAGGTLILGTRRRYRS